MDRKGLESCYKGVQGREVMSPNNPEKKMWSRLCPREDGIHLYGQERKKL